MEIVELQSEQNQDIEYEKDLFLTFIKTDIGKKINNYLYSLVEQVKSSGGVVVFLSRKGYWLYRFFRKYVLWRNCFNGMTAVSDRYVAKWVNKDWKGRTIYIVDDTVTSGSTMFSVYQKIREQYPSSKIVTVAIFSLVTKSELKENYVRQLSSDSQEKIEIVEKTEKYQEFLNTLIFGEVSMPTALGWLSYNQIALFQQLLSPYVIDLPLMKNENERPLALEKFEELKEIKGNWLYVDNSYRLSDIDITEGNIENVQCGFFQYTDSSFLQSMTEYVFQMVVKCHYKRIHGEKIELIFTPFAVLKSMEWQKAKDICLKLYEKTNFGKWLLEALNNESESSQGEIEHGVLVYRAIVYFFSMYGGQLFKETLESSYGININFDLELLNENSSEPFIGTAKKIGDEWKETDFRDRIYAAGIGDYTCEPMDYTDETAFNAKQERSVYFEVYKEVIRRKREGSKADPYSGFVSLEDLYRNAEPTMQDLSKAARYRLFMKVLLQMLDKSVLGNRLICKGGYISRGFRFGENSDIALPFYNGYIYEGVLELYNQYKSIYPKDLLKEEFPEGITLLMKGIAARARNNGYLNLLISEWELQCNQWYFSDCNGDFASLVENKSFRLDYGRRNKAVVEDILFCVDEIVRY